MYSVGQSSEGDFTYDYSPNPSIISASGIKNGTAKKRMLRELQSTSGTASTSSGTKITNPVMCIKQGSAVLFSVNASTHSYPAYLKDSILNTNLDFDYGSFLSLAKTID